MGIVTVVWIIFLIISYLLSNTRVGLMICLIFLIGDIFLPITSVLYLLFLRLIPRTFELTEDGILVEYFTKTPPIGIPPFIQWSRIQKIDQRVLVFSWHIKPKLDHSLTVSIDNEPKTIMIHETQQKLILDAHENWKRTHSGPHPFGGFN